MFYIKTKQPAGSAYVHPKPSAFLESVIAYLLPYFIGTAADVQDIRSEIVETLASYATRTRAELLLAAQTIALGMTTLDVLAESRTADMSISLRIRHRGCAHRLNRATLATEKALNERLAGAPPSTLDQAATLIGQPVAVSHPHPVAAATSTGRTRPATDQAASAPLHPITSSAPLHPITSQDVNRHLWAGAMMDTLRQIGIPNRPPPSA